MNKILDKLNDQQLRAVKDTSQFIQINAGPGTGKTTTLGAKMLYTQVELEVPVSNMVGISFSRSAKSHLLNKLEEFTDQLGYGGKPPILTFHSLAFRIIKKAIELGDSKFKEYIEHVDTHDLISYQPNLMKDLCKEYKDGESKKHALCEAFNKARQGNLLDGPSLSWKEVKEDEIYHVPTYVFGRLLVNGQDLKEFWKRVDKIERKFRVTDYNGMITEAINILKNKGKTYEYFTNLYDYIFVDEYQDTSLAQEMLLFALISNKQHVTVVGDKNQTIYSFNGSNSYNLDRFFQQATSLYNTEPTKIILNRNYRSPQQILDVTNSLVHEEHYVYSETRTLQQPVVVETHNYQLASHYISTEIEKLINQEKVTPSNICILYRKNSEHSPQADTVKEHLNQLEIEYTEEVSNRKTEKSLSQKVLSLQEQNQGEDLEDIIETIEDERTKQFVKECMSDGATDSEDLLEYLVELEEIEESFTPTQKEAVHIRTVHSAKGLEFPYVFIIYLGDKEFPHSSKPDIEEERRLLYVGLSRAQKQLYIIGKKGLHFESFLDHCLLTDVKHIPYHTFMEEKFSSGFSNKDKKAIDRTGNKQTSIIDEMEDLQGLFND
ncbi:UvrD-helicase domain-containing protein [Halobacillus halophilus]|uniref:UvrD-helicase domain-containing protein n=1 Tax=Halobacillus halophilus TaxID=1570 RepID=UPI001CD40970|nr:ATP-dependent helicase [Halobacillus halophilus]MCA1011760.1 ATP-dependent helicase [Halobacillus halophilus]